MILFDESVACVGSNFLNLSIKGDAAFNLQRPLWLAML